MKKRRLNLFFCMLGLAGLLWLGLLAGWLSPIEQRLYDVRARFAAGSMTPDPDIVVVAIDDDSLQALQGEWGRWPWSRRAMARALEHLSEARVVVFDILFSEQAASEADADAALVRAACSHGGVLTAAYQPAMDADLLRPFPDLAACVGMGHAHFQADRDGVVRRHLLRREWNEASVPSLALAAAERFNGLQVASAWPDEFLLRWSRQPHEVVPIRKLFGVPAVSKEFFRGKLVWVGSTATGVEADRQATSLRPYVPGVQTLAMASDNLLHGQRYQSLPPAMRAALLVALAALASLLLRVRPFSTLALFVSCLALYLGAAWWAAWWGWMLPVVVPAGMVGLGGSLAAFQSWRREQADRLALQELDRARQNFTDMLVHDMKNQMQPLTMTLQLLQDAGADDAATRKRLARASASAARLGGQVDQLLSIRQIQEGTLPVRPVACPLGETVDLVIDEFAVAAERARIKVQSQVPGDMRVHFDRDLLSRVVENLVWNAIQHAPAGTDVQVTAIRAVDGAPVMTVSNEGPVVPPERLRRVFEPFVSDADLSRADRMGGAGLGLAFCRLAVEALGGTIEMKSPRPGEVDGVLVETRFGRDA